MAGVADPNAQEPEFAAAFAAREVVGGQIAELLRERSFPGSKGQVTERLRDVVRFERQGDPSPLRAALVELAVSAGAWAATLDALIPPEPPRRTRRKV